MTVFFGNELKCLADDYINVTKKTIEAIEELLDKLLALKESTDFAVLLNVDEKIFYLKKFRDELMANRETCIQFIERYYSISNSDGQYPANSGGTTALHVTNDRMLEQAHNCESTATRLSRNIDGLFEKVLHSFRQEMSSELADLIACVDRYKRTSCKLADICFVASSRYREMYELYLQACCAQSMTSFDSSECTAKPEKSCEKEPAKDNEGVSFDTGTLFVPPYIDVSESVPPPSPTAAPTASRPPEYYEERKIGVEDLLKSQKKRQKRIFGLFRSKEKNNDKRKSDSVVPPPQIDSVKFSAVSDKKVVPGKYLPINIVMYEDEFRKAVDKIIDSHGGNAKESVSGYHNVERNSTVKVVLASPDIAIENGVEERVWNGKYLDFSFAVKIPRDFSDEQILFSASVYVNDIIATKLQLILDCDRKHRCSISMSRSDVVSAFVSYASQDRNRVASIIQGMKKARPDMDIFFDIEYLRSGQKWEEALKREIESRDILFLCWSKYAKESKWVDMEWRYALENKGEDCIEPIPIDSPDVCPPPDELKQKHFNDKMLFIIKASASVE